MSRWKGAFVNLPWPGARLKAGYFFASRTVQHGPKSWPWWRLVSPSWVKLRGVTPPTEGWCLWLYTRWGAVSWDFYLDRRLGR